MLKVIAFDLDGTLFDHQGSAGNAIRRVVQENSWGDSLDVKAKWQELEGIYFTQFANGEITTNEESVKNWKAVQEHREAQRLGKEKFYLEYSVKVATVYREY